MHVVHNGGEVWPIAHLWRQREHLREDIFYSTVKPLLETTFFLLMSTDFAGGLSFCLEGSHGQHFSFIISY
jgi:hypothetical protein